MEYVIEIFVLVAGIAFVVTGAKKKLKLISGIGIGVLATFVILGFPDLIDGFNAGFEQ